jgi:hypothetical protein
MNCHSYNITMDVIDINMYVFQHEDPNDGWVLDPNFVITTKFTVIVNLLKYMLYKQGKGPEQDLS